MWGRLTDGLQRFQDKLDSVIDQTLKDATDDAEGAQDGNHENDVSSDVTETAQTSSPMDQSEHDRLLRALEEAENQNKHINKEFQQLLRDKEVRRNLCLQIDT